MWGKSACGSKVGQTAWPARRVSTCNSTSASLPLSRTSLGHTRTVRGSPPNSEDTPTWEVRATLCRWTGLFSLHPYPASLVPSSGKLLSHPKLLSLLQSKGLGLVLLEDIMNTIIKQGRYREGRHLGDEAPVFASEASQLTTNHSAKLQWW